jgi:hypothetical protein
LGITGSYTVTAVLAHVDEVIEYLAIDGEQVETTPEHPFFTREYGWLPAGELSVGMHIRKANGEYGVVQAVEVVQRQQPMYNLTVAGAHTFFVGQQRWLVHHNTCPIEGQKVYRVFGNRAKAYGRSWTPIDPRTIPDYASSAGLPKVNAGKYLSEGVLADTNGIVARRALPIGGNVGGLVEYVIPDPKNQIIDIITTRLLKRLGG